MSPEEPEPSKDIDIGASPDNVFEEICAVGGTGGEDAVMVTLPWLVSPVELVIVRVAV